MGIDGEFLLQMLMPPEDGRAGQAIDDNTIQDLYKLKKFNRKKDVCLQFTIHKVLLHLIGKTVGFSSTAFKD